MSTETDKDTEFIERIRARYGDVICGNCTNPIQKEQTIKIQRFKTESGNILTAFLCEACKDLNL